MCNQPNRKTPVIKHVDLGGAVVCNYCVEESTDSDNAAEQEFNAWSLWDGNGPQH